MQARIHAHMQARAHTHKFRPTKPHPRIQSHTGERAHIHIVAQIHARTYVLKQARI